MRAREDTHVRKVREREKGGGKELYFQSFRINIIIDSVPLLVKRPTKSVVTSLLHICPHLYCRVC